MKDLTDRPTMFPPNAPTPEQMAARRAARLDGIRIVECHTGSDGPYPSMPEFGTFRYRCPACGDIHFHGGKEGLRNSHCPQPGVPSTIYVIHHHFAGWECEDIDR